MSDISSAKSPDLPRSVAARDFSAWPQSLSRARKLNGENLPKILHQSWRSTKLESYQREWQQSWLKHHPDWTYMFWTDKDNRKLVSEHFPWFLDVYDGFPRNIQRADCARYFYMLRYGGCYFDLDFESLRNIEPLLQHVHVALAYMTNDTASDISLPNAFLASAPGHQFWWYVIKRILMAVASSDIDDGDAHRVTGPVMLKAAVAQFQQSSTGQDLTIFPAVALYGVDFNWRGDPAMSHIFAYCHAASESFNATKCKTFFPESFAITYWSGDLTWMAG